MLKFGLKLLFCIFTQLIAIIISYEFFFRYAVFHGGIGHLNAISAVNPLIWFIIVIELIISIYLLAVGIRDKAQKSSKH